MAGCLQHQQVLLLLCTNNICATAFSIYACVTERAPRHARLPRQWCTFRKVFSISAILHRAFDDIQRGRCCVACCLMPDVLQTTAILLLLYDDEECSGPMMRSILVGFPDPWTHRTCRDRKYFIRRSFYLQDRRTHPAIKITATSIIRRRCSQQGDTASHTDLLDSL